MTKMIEKKIVNIPNAAIVEVAQTCVEMGKQGYTLNVGKSYFAFNLSYVETVLMFEEANPVIEAVRETYEEVLKEVDTKQQEVSEKAKVEEEVDFSTGSKDMDAPIILSAEAGEALLADLEKQGIIAELNAATKNDQLKLIAAKYNLKVDSRYKAPNALRKFLLSQLEQ